MTDEFIKSLEVKLDKHDINFEGSKLPYFGLALQSINLDAVIDFASTIRRSGHESTRNANVDTTIYQADWIDCKIHDPLCGSFNMVFPIEFADGVRWMLRIPTNGHGDKFDSLAAKSLVSEARTMQLIKDRTSVPVPEVYAFDTSLANPLNVPFIMMEQLPGKPLYECWFNMTWSKARLEEFRVRFLKSLSGAMVELNQFTVDSSDSLDIDSNGILVVVSGTKTTDWFASLSRNAEDEGPKKVGNVGEPEDWSNMQQQETDTVAENVQGQAEIDIHGANEDVRHYPWYERGPFRDPKEFVSHNLDHPDSVQHETPFEQGSQKSVRLFIDWAFEVLGKLPPTFVLNHPDLDTQNILVDEDGTLTGLIDWDGAGAVPHAVGCLQYPLWLMGDWVPGRYKYNDEEVSWESSPDELASYRAMYAQLMENEIQHTHGGPEKLASHGLSPKEAADVTRRSLLIRSLELAANTPEETMDIVHNIFEQITSITAEEWKDRLPDSDPALGGSCPSACKEDENYAQTGAGEIGGEPSSEDQNNTLTLQARMEQLLLESVAKVKEKFDEPLSSQEVPPAVSTPIGYSATQAELGTMSRKAKVPKGACSLVEKGLRRTAKCLHRCDGNRSSQKNDLEPQHIRASRMRLFLSWLREKLMKIIHCLPNTDLSHIASMNSSSTAVNEPGNDSPEREKVAVRENSPEVPCVGDVTGMYIADVLVDINIKKPGLLSEPGVMKQAAKRAAKAAADEAAQTAEAAAEQAAEAEINEVWALLVQHVHKNCGIPISQLKRHQMDMAYLMINTLQAEQKPEKEGAARAFFERVVAKVLHVGAKNKQAEQIKPLAKNIGAEVAKADAFLKTCPLPPPKSDGAISGSSASDALGPTSKEMELAGFGRSEPAVANDADKAVVVGSEARNPDVAAHWAVPSKKRQQESFTNMTSAADATSAAEFEPVSGVDLDNEAAATDAISPSRAYTGDVEGQSWNRVWDAGDGNGDDEARSDTTDESSSSDDGDGEDKDDEYDGEELDDDEEGEKQGDGNEQREEEKEEEFVDTGAFNIQEICNVIGRGEKLDDLRMTRLRHGFFKLLECCQISMYSDKLG